MEKKIENMTKKELIERINDLETQCADKDTSFAALHDQHVKFGQRTAQEIAAYETKIANLKKQVFEAATAREDDFNILKKKNESIHEEAKRWKKEAVEAQAELDDLRSAIGADDSDPISVAIWKAKYHTLKYQFDKFKDEDRKWTSANPAVQASLERKINVLERGINKYKAVASEWEAKYEYQKGQTDCVVSDYNNLNKKYEALVVDFNIQKDTIFRLKAELENLTENKHCLEGDINYYRSQLSKYKDSSDDYKKLLARFDNLCIDHARVSRDYNRMVDQTTKAAALEERNKDLIKQCDELYDKNKELDAENSYLTDEVDNLKKKLKDSEQRNVYLYDKNNRLKKTVNKIYGVASGIPDIADTADFEDRARRCAIIFSRTIDDMINAYNTDVNSYYDGSILGVTKTVNTIRGGKIWLDALEESMRKFSEEAEKYIKRVGEKK